MTSPGWYPDPAGLPLQRYFDGSGWTDHTAPVVREPASIVQGPNHVLHAILTLLTFPLCGGWGWVWLVIAMNDKKKVRYVR